MRTPLLSAFVLLSLLSAAPALAAREPTLREREQITNSYPAYIRNAPVRCVFLKIRISSRDPHYAHVVAHVLNALKPRSPCLRYAHNGFNILRKQRGKWKVTYSGSDAPPCSLKIPGDLTPCRRR